MLTVARRSVARDLVAQRVGRIDAQQGHVGGEVVQLLERALDVGVVWMALDVGIELGSREYKP